MISSARIVRDAKEPIDPADADRLDTLWDRPMFRSALRKAWNATGADVDATLRRLANAGMVERIQDRRWKMTAAGLDFLCSDPPPDVVKRLRVEVTHD